MELEKLQNIIAGILCVDASEVTMETTFVEDLGADSLDIFQILLEVEETFDIKIDEIDADEIVSVGDAVNAIKKALQ